MIDCVIDAFEEAVLKLAKKYSNIVLLNTDCSRYVGAEKFSKHFENRYFNLGLAEGNMVSCAAGFSVRGKIPFVTGFSSFLVGKAWEQIRNGVCYPNLNVKIVGTHAGFSGGEEGVGCQAFEDIALMRSLPNMKVVCPADYREALSVFEVLAGDYGPTYVRLYEGGMPDVVDKDCKFEFGKASVLREGKDVCIFALGRMVSESLGVADMLEEKGIDAGVVNVSSVKPIDVDTVLECSRGVKLCVTVEDHNVIGGLGSAVAEVLGEKNPVRLKRIGMEDRFGESGKPEDLYRKYKLDAEGIFGQIVRLVT